MYVLCYEKNLRVPTKQKYRAHFEQCPHNTCLALGPGLVLSEAQRFFPVSLPSEAMHILFELQERLAGEETLGASWDVVTTCKCDISLVTEWSYLPLLALSRFQLSLLAFADSQSTSSHDKDYTGYHDDITAA